MRKFFRLVLLAMILLVIALMSALTAMRVAIHGRETSVPNFVKLTLREAEQAAVGAGLSLAMEGQFYSTDVPEGRIVSQMPPPGTRVRRGWRVRLAESLGPQRVVIPNVLGQSARAAELNVRQRGLKLGSVAQANLPGAVAEQIVAQSPPPNASGVQSPLLDVLIAAEAGPEQYVMPNFVGRPFSEAASVIESSGFKIGSVARQPMMNGSSAPTQLTPITSAMITRQTPAPGQKVTPDAAIRLEVSR